MKRKLNLDALKVQSFITNLDGAGSIKGGGCDYEYPSEDPNIHCGSGISGGGEGLCEEFKDTFAMCAD